MKLVLLLLWAVAGAASAHTLAPALLEIQAQGDQRYTALWRVDVRNTQASPRWPDQCRAELLERRLEATALDSRWRLDCPDGLAGQRIAIDKLQLARTTALLRYHDIQGREFRRLLSAEAPAVGIPASLEGGRLWLQYLQLGGRHILGGIDHLLLVLALFLLASRWQALLIDVTAFTLGHSLTLGLASLTDIWLPAAWVELAIALSVLWLAMELCRPAPRRQHAGLLVAFGLIHGLGFAGALRDLGLPRHDQIPALLSFNLGIELGQVAVLGLLWSLRRLTSPWQQRPAHALRPATIYLIGGLAAFWSLQRGWLLLA